MLVEAVARLDDRRVRQLAVDADDLAVGAVIEATVDADRSVDAVHHPHLVAREAPQPPEVEVEGVVETRGRPAREPVDLDRELAALQLPDECEQELVAAAVRRRPELVEDGQIGPLSSRAQPVGLGPAPARERTHRTQRKAQGRLC